MDRFVCVHGHFYQPPRENPWLEAIEVQDSAAPFHDWNERVTSECYAPNATSRMLDDAGRIQRIVNNYAHISFNVGPTLLAWMEVHAAATYRAILDADAAGQERFGGHGPALAQVYGHPILPLANDRDKRTQILWGLRDFERRFGRKPEGMWLPETAVDIASLEALADAGMAFTILAPGQAARVRPLAGGNWHDVSGARVDPTRAYRHHLPSGRHIDLFFYDGPLAREVAFERLLQRGENLAHRLASALDDPARPQLAHIATDGETYGHHHRFGEMALSRALSYLEEEGIARLTIYGEFLEHHPPELEVQIVENSSWSCAHGVERWRNDCGCRTGGEPHWNQAWRAPLRAALDGLRDTLVPRFEDEGNRLLRDPWAARDAYIDVVLDRGRESVNRFLEEHAERVLDAEERVRTLRLMELQRHAMLMTTSCGWFFNDLAGIETVQILRYAGRAVQLAEEVFGESFEEPFLKRLEEASSNDPEHGSGRAIYERGVRPSRIDLLDVAAHYAVSHPFETYGARTRVFGFDVEEEDLRSERSGRATLVTGRIRVRSRITEDTSQISYGVLHLGDHTVTAGARRYKGTDKYTTMVEDVASVFNRGDFPAVLRRLDAYFGERTYSLESLFRDEQRKILDMVLASSLHAVEEEYRRIYDAHAGLMRYLARLDSPQPPAFRYAARVTVGSELRAALADEGLPVEKIRRLVQEAAEAGMDLHVESLAYTFRRTLEGAMEQLVALPGDRRRLERLTLAVGLLDELPFRVDPWRIQNLYYGLLTTVYPETATRAGNDADAAAWASAFAELGRRLAFRVERS